ncbi:hypothetical protein F5X98DRAFT_359559 [Xylaria grammica]|nr:hypothetical protein F5X98DRAFT_359559 [Xylaria grammica]
MHPAQPQNTGADVSSRRQDDYRPHPQNLVPFPRAPVPITPTAGTPLRPPVRLNVLPPLYPPPSLSADHPLHRHNAAINEQNNRSLVIANRDDNGNNNGSGNARNDSSTIHPHPANLLEIHLVLPSVSYMRRKGAYGGEPYFAALPSEVFSAYVERAVADRRESGGGGGGGGFTAGSAYSSPSLYYRGSGMDNNGHGHRYGGDGGGQEARDASAWWMAGDVLRLVADTLDGEVRACWEDAMRGSQRRGQQQQQHGRDDYNHQHGADQHHQRQNLAASPVYESDRFSLTLRALDSMASSMTSRPSPSPSPSPPTAPNPATATATAIAQWEEEVAACRDQIAGLDAELQRRDSEIDRLGRIVQERENEAWRLEWEMHRLNVDLGQLQQEKEQKEREDQRAQQQQQRQQDDSGVDLDDVHDHGGQGGDDAATTVMTDDVAPSFTGQRERDNGRVGGRPASAGPFFPSPFRFEGEGEAEKEDNENNNSNESKQTTEKGEAETGLGLELELKRELDKLRAELSEKDSTIARQAAYITQLEKQVSEASPAYPSLNPTTSPEATSLRHQLATRDATIRSLRATIRQHEYRAQTVDSLRKECAARGVEMPGAKARKEAFVEALVRHDAEHGRDEEGLEDEGDGGEGGL